MTATAWYLWTAKYGEYLIGTKHKNWLGERLTFRFYPIDEVEFTEALLMQRLPFMRELREYLTVPTRAFWNDPRLDLRCDADSPNLVLTKPAKLNVHGFLWGIEDLDDHPIHAGFVPLGMVIAERPDDFTAKIPVQPSGRLINVEWGPVAFKRANHAAMVNMMQMNKVEELHPGFDPKAVIRRLDKNPFAPSGSLSSVASGNLTNKRRFHK